MVSIRNMKDSIIFTILCTLSMLSVAQGTSRRRLQLNPMASIEQTEVMQGAMSVMVSREDPADANSRVAPCSSPSALWLREQVADVSDEDLTNFFDWHVYTLPFVYKLFVEPKSRHPWSHEYFGIDGEYTQEIQNIHDRAQDFWSNSGVEDDISLLCAHGSDLADRHEKLIPTLELVFGKSYDDEYTVFDHASEIQDLIMRLPGGYDHPLLTFNAFATDKDGDDNPSIIIGDGYFEFQESVGIGTEGPEYALTHEHAHHLQFSLGVNEEDMLDSGQANRRQELMADAFSAYFLTHQSGGDMSADEISNIHTIAYSVGDCEISNDGHHGTPQQRRCATKFGASMADSEEVDDLNLTDLKDRFDLWYEQIDNLDASCDQAYSSAANTRSSIVHSLQVLTILFGCTSMFGFL